MTKKSLCLLFFLTIFLICCADKDPITPETTLEDEINQLAAENLKVGMVIGIIKKNQEKLIFTYGSKSREANEKPDENTVFDIGSMTKTFTATLLTEIYLNGTFTDDTVDHYLPQNVEMPKYNDTVIRIVHLLTHTSGLPRTPHEAGQTYPIPPKFNDENPYQNYTTDMVYDYLTNYCQLNFEPGTYWEYSNTGFGLLGHLVGLVNNSTYEDVLQTKIFGQLGMSRSSLFLTEEQMTNYSLGYNTDLQNVPYYLANDIFQGAGFIKSTLNDLFKYLDAQIGLTQTNLKNPMDMTHEPQAHIGTMGEQALAWFVLTLDDGQTIIYSGGDTQGHSSYIGFNKSLSTGAIVLSNYAMHGPQLTMGHKILEIINKY
ncbi:MAG: beta-lactamase family protein [Ignavibacteriae bacterium]|nr:beta-lactamase family protein [Ignavibacteriota bacterium]MCB9208332.1 beta-lactamase family protein [Ignavibacteriales bacterium]MCB9259094.1 beta-lactamase family protein [Ignavibacteriales bacterium]